jgi:hypothetical protein
MQAASIYAALSIASLAGGMLACCLIVPEYFLGPGGVSNYGADRRTIVPYTAGFLAASGFAYAAARHYPRDTPRTAAVSRGITLFAVLLALTMASTFPYQLAPLYYWIHAAIGSLLMGWLVLFGAWLALAENRNVLTLLLLAALVVASSVAAYSFFGPGRLLSHGQVGAVLAFGLLLIAQARRVGRA